MSKKATIEITFIPTAKDSGNNIVLKKAVYHRKSSSFLSEAFRFYNFGAEGAHFIRKKNWAMLTSFEIENSIAKLKKDIENSIAVKVKALAPNEPSNNMIFKHHLNKDLHKTVPMTNSAYQGMYAARLWFDPLVRSEKKLEELKNPNTRKQVYFRAFERLTGIRQKLKEELANVDFCSGVLLRQFSSSKSAKKDDLNALFFTPSWGGEWISISLEYKKAVKTQNEMGPAEKLNLCLCSEIFYPRIIEWLHKKPKSKPGAPFAEMHSKLYNELELVLPVSMPKVWSDWFQNITLLENLLDYLNEKSPFWFNMLGLPVAYLYINGLRTYLTDLITRALIVAYSSCIQPIYDNISAYAALSFWEAITGKPLSGLTQYGILPPEMLGCLTRWNFLIKEDDPWDDSEEHLKIKRGLFTKDLQAKGGNDRSKSQPLIIEKFADSLPQYPVLNSFFFKTLGLGKERIVNETRWLLGATFTAQAHVYIASYLLNKALEITNLKSDFDKSENQRLSLPKYKDFRRHMKNFYIGAGSNIWSGKKPPHQTHRDGHCFDLNFGPNLIQWPISKAQEQYLALLKNPEVMKGVLLTNPAFKTKHSNKNYRDLLIVCSTQQDLKNLPEKPYKNKIIIRSLVSDLIKKKFNLLYQFCDKTLENDLQKFEENELNNYISVISSLTGTPHFFQPNNPQKMDAGLDDWLRCHIAHAAILLSAPGNIVFASPIVHVRAMYAVRKGLLGASKMAYQLGSEVVKGAAFSFLPHNHHHHWHVDYKVPKWSTIKNCKGNLLTRPYERLAYFAPLWLELGVDLKPFLEYLEKYEFNPNCLLPETFKAEFTFLKAFIKKYVNQFNEIYGTSSNPNSNARSVSDNILQSIFSLYIPSQSNQISLTEPTISLQNGKLKMSGEMKEVATTSWDFIYSLYSVLKIQNLITEIGKDIKEEEYSSELVHQELDNILEFTKEMWELSKDD